MAHKFNRLEHFSITPAIQTTSSRQPYRDGLCHFPRTKEARKGAPTCVDLFAGAGGMAEGFRQAGFTILSGNDIDAGAGATFRYNFPGASFFQSPISELTGTELLKDAGITRGELDCLIGGPPCQSFSYNNHLRSQEDARARLFEDYLRIVRDLRPRSLVMENVPGILTISGGAIVDEIYSSLKTLDYACEARILYAEDYGVPQQRRRVFFLATRLSRTAAPLFPHGQFGPVQKPSEQVNPRIHRWSLRRGQQRLDPPSVWDAIGDLPPIGNGGGTPKSGYAREPLTAYQKRLRRRQRRLYSHVAPTLGRVLLERIRHVPEGGNWRDIPFDLLPAGMQRAKATDHTKRYGRLRKDGLCCTILTKCDPHWGSYIHPEYDRTISVREAARLQSFRDGFRFCGGLSRQFMQVGNAVPPLLAAAIAKSIRRHIRQHG